VTVTSPVSCTPARVPTSTVVATLAALNATRKAAIIVNEASAVLYVKYGATATSTDYTYAVAAGGTLELAQPIYCGAVTGILASGTGNAQVSVY
jgi:hypothetical protein